MKNRILIVSRDVAIRARLARLLIGSGYRVELTDALPPPRRNGPAGFALAIVVHDKQGFPEDRLPAGLDGAADQVLIVARGDPDRRGAGVLDAGDETALLDRIAEMMRPAPAANRDTPAVLGFAGYRLDLAGHSLLDPAGNEVSLTRGEFKLLQEFAQRPGRVLSRDQLLQALSGREAEAYDRSIDMLVVRLRRKIEPEPKQPRLIVAVPGSGYKFTPGVQCADHPSAQADDAPHNPAPAERRQVTALSAELVPAHGTTLPADPEELRAIIDAFRRRAATIVVQHGGVVAQCVAREILGYFGHPVGDENATAHAIRAGLALARDRAGGNADMAADLAIRIGIATGLVVADPAGEAIGAPPSEAARIRNLAEPGRVIVAESARQLAGPLFAYHALGPPDGISGPTPAWQVLDQSALASRSEALYGSQLTPLVGRAEERELLLHVWRRAKSGEGRVVLLSGEPGIGKSRLLVELEACLATETRTRLRYFCSPLHQHSALHPIIVHWEHACRFTRGDTAEQRLGKLQSVLPKTEFSATDVALLAGMLDIPAGESYRLPDLTPQQRKERTLGVLQRRLRFLAQGQPVLMLFEDAHWADHSSLEWLDTLVSQIAEFAILLVISFRPEFIPPWIGRPGLRVMPLTRLDRREAAELAAKVRVSDGMARSYGVPHQPYTVTAAREPPSGGRPPSMTGSDGGDAAIEAVTQQSVTAAQVLPPATLDRIIAQTDGVPLFIEELTKSILENPSDGLSLAPAVPNTLQASLMARLDRLPAAKHAAQIAAVAGREFSHVLLHLAAGPADAQLTKGIDELVAAGLVFRRGLPPDAVYTFKHALVQDTAYESLLRPRRQHIHLRIAETVRDQFPEWANAQPEIVAHHFTQAGVPAPAVEWWGKAGDFAMRRSAYAEAIAHFEKAIQQASELPNGPDLQRSRLRLQIAYANALRVGRGFGVPETQAAFAKAADLAAAVEDVSERFPALFGLWVGSLVRGDLTPMQEAAAAFLRDAGPESGSPEAAMAYRMCGLTCWFEGDFVAARRNLEQALAISDATRDREMVLRFGLDMTTLAIAYLALVLWPLGFADRASSLIEEAVTQAAEIGHIPTITIAQVYAVHFETMRGDRSRTAPLVHRLLALARERAIPEGIAIGTFAEGWLRWGAGDREEGMAEMHEGMTLVRLQQRGCFVPMQMTRLAEAEAEAGRPEVGLDIVDRQLAIAERTGQRWFLAEILRARGEILLKCQPCDAAAAEAAFMRAIGVARGQAAKLFELQSALSLARLWMAEGHWERICDLLAPICAWFGEDLDVGPVKEASGLLSDLAAKDFKGLIGGSF